MPFQAKLVWSCDHEGCAESITREYTKKDLGIDGSLDEQWLPDQEDQATTTILEETLLLWLCTYEKKKRVQFFFCRKHWDEWCAKNMPADTIWTG